MSYCCGIDLGAKRSQVCIIDNDQKVLVNRKVANDIEVIHRLIRPHGRVPTVIESTFNWYWIVDGLQDRQLPVTLAHSLKLAAISSAQVKTDKRDALVLAQLLRANMIPTSYIYPAEQRPLRDLLRQRWDAVALRADEYRKMRGRLYREGITTVGSNEVMLMGAEEVNELIDHPLIRRQMMANIERVELLTRQIKIFEKELLAQVKTQPDSTNRKSIPGIGDILALTLLLEIGEISRFPKARQFASYCRVAPGCADSGDSHRRGRGNKQGDPYLKWALTQAAEYARRFDRQFADHFDTVLRKHPGASGTIMGGQGVPCPDALRPVGRCIGSHCLTTQDRLGVDEGHGLAVSVRGDDDGVRRHGRPGFADGDGADLPFQVIVLTLMGGRLVPVIIMRSTRRRWRAHDHTISYVPESDPGHRAAIATWCGTSGDSGKNRWLRHWDIRITLSSTTRAEDAPVASAPAGAGGLSVFLPARKPSRYGTDFRLCASPQGSVLANCCAEDGSRCRR